MTDTRRVFGECTLLTAIFLDNTAQMSRRYLYISGSRHPRLSLPQINCGMQYVACYIVDTGDCHLSDART